MTPLWATHNDRRRPDTSTRPLDHYERCHFPGGHLSGPVTADVFVADVPLCERHAAERLAGILRGLPHADRYYPRHWVDAYSEVAL